MADQISTLRRALLDNTRILREGESRQFFKPNDFRWGEFVDDGQNRTIAINFDKFRDAGVNVQSKGFVDDMVLGESLHNLKNLVPEQYDRLEAKALQVPNYRRNAVEAYKMARRNGEERSFKEWHRQSRFDQVIGGFVLAGSENIPTMKNWSRDHPMFQGAFRSDLEKLARALGK